MDLEKIKIVISEIDGVITEHLSGIGEYNTVMFKQFCMKDFEAINLMKKHWGFVFLSSDANINLSLCKKRNIPFYFAERNKAEVYKNIILKLNLSPENVLYVGSAYSDIECLQMSGLSACPDDAVNKVKTVSDCVLPLYSGTGVLCYIYEMLEGYRLTKIREV